MNKMLLECDESLPSHSAFIAQTIYSNDTESKIKFNIDKNEDRSQFLNKDKNSLLSPPSSQDIQYPAPYQYSNNNMMNSSLENNNFSNETVKPTSKPKSPIGTFTFLRKNSRKEPSALNRTSPSKSPNTKDIQIVSSHTPKNLNKMNNSNNLNISQHYNQNKNTINTLDHTMLTDNNEEIMLSGSSYWGLEETDTYIKGYISKQQSPQVDATKEVEDILENSTITMVTKQWALQKNDFQQELKEFELIEKQLEINTNSNSNNKDSNNDKLIGSKNNSYASENNPQIAMEASSYSSSDHIVNDKNSRSYQFNNVNNFDMNQSAVSTSNFMDTSYPFRTTEASINDNNNCDIYDFDDLDTTTATINNNNNYSADFSSIAKENTMHSSFSSILDSQSWGKPTQPCSSNYDHDPILSKNKTNNYDSNNMIKTRLSNNTLKKINALQQRQLPQYNIASNELLDNNSKACDDLNNDLGSQNNKALLHPLYDQDLYNHEDGISNNNGNNYNNSDRHIYNNDNNSNHISNNNNTFQDENPWGEDSYLDNEYNSHSNPHNNNNFNNIQVDENGYYNNNYSESIKSQTPLLPSSSSNPIILTRPISSQSKVSNSNNNHTHTRNSRNNNNNSKSSSKLNLPYENDELQKSLIEKAHALETELDTYKNENINLKKLRKQQEHTLSEIMSQKEDLYNWIESEKQKTITWCNEQKQLALKERNQVAKLVRDSRQKTLNNSQTIGGVSIRKEKAEIEGLQATIEKLKLDYDNATKKWKSNENRLYSSIKDHTIHIESNEKQLLCLEQEKLLLLEFISDQGLRLPKHLRSLLQKNPTNRISNNNNNNNNVDNSNSWNSNKKNSRSIGSNSLNINNNYHNNHNNPTSNSIYEMELNGYVEEIDVDDLDIISTTTIKINDTSIQKEQHQGAIEYDYNDNYNSTFHSTTTNNNNLSTTKLSNNTSVKDSHSVLKGVVVNNNRYHTSNTHHNMDEDEPLMNTTTSTCNSNPLMHSSNNYLNDDSINKSRNSLSNSIQHLSQSILPPTPIKNIESIHNNNYNNTNNIQNNTLNNIQNDNINNSRIEEILPNGKRIIKYKNGTQKEIDLEGNTIVRFLNGDSKRTEIKSGLIIYYYALADTRHTTYPDGLEVYEFPNKQLEKHFPNGMKEIIFPDTTRKVITTDGIQECYFPDGVVLREYADGRKAIISNIIDKNS